MESKASPTTGAWKVPMAALFRNEGAAWPPLRAEQDAQTVRIYDATGAMVVCLGTSHAAIFRHTGEPERLRAGPRD